MTKALMKPKVVYLKKLDSLRGLAAFYVILHHFILDLDFISLEIKELFFSFGQEAVMIFFILSGFVIYYSVERSKDLNFKSYFIKRFRRIYPIFIISLLVSIIIFFFNGSLAEDFSWSNFFGNLFMLQDFAEVKPGTWFDPFLANYPLWSLSYEWWFYLLFFPCYRLLPKSSYRIYFILVISALSFGLYNLRPNQVFLWLSYYVIWWCGVELADIYLHQGRFTFKKLTPVFVSLLFMLSLSLIPILHIHIYKLTELKLGYYPFLTFRHFFAASLALFLGFIWYRHKMYWFDNLLGSFALIAPISYGLYILHYPILNYLHLETYHLNSWLSYLIKFVLIFGLAYLTEIKLQPLINKVIKPAK
jgi:peptidoglycan/LPS O-acetylase OafA/YrhL